MAPDLVEVVAGVIREHVVGWQFDGRRSRLECDCGAEVIAGDGAAHQARAVLDALTEAGTVEWGVAYNLSDGSMFVDPCVDRGEADLRTGWDGAVYDFVVSRLTLPWTAVE